MATGTKDHSDQDKLAAKARQLKNSKTRNMPSRETLALPDQHALHHTPPWMVGFIVGEQRKTIEHIVQKKTTLGRSITKKLSEYNAHIDLSKVGALEAGVSRIHAALYVHSNGVSLQDVGSTNGTFLNGYRLETFTDVPLQNNDVIVLGKLKLQVAFLYQMPT